MHTQRGHPRSIFKHRVAAIRRFIRASSWVGFAALVFSVSDVKGQATDGSATAAAAGGVLGLASGATLGLTGSLVPCSKTYFGAACVRWSAAAGGAIGLASGVLIGTADQNRIERAATTAGIGAVAGLAAGLAISQFAQRFGWMDVATVGLLGAAIGATPRGAAIGVAAGGAVGLVLWQAIPGFHLPDAAGAAVAGMTLGSLVQWVWSAADAHHDPGNGTQLIVPLTIRF